VDDVIIVQLDSVKKWRNTQEWRPVNRASITYNGQYMEEVGDHSVIVSLLKALTRNHSPPCTAQVEVRRGEVPVFLTMPLKQWVNPAKKPIPDGLLAYHKRRKSA